MKRMLGLALLFSGAACLVYTVYQFTSDSLGWHRVTAIGAYILFGASILAGTALLLEGLRGKRRNGSQKENDKP